MRSSLLLTIGDWDFRRSWARLVAGFVFAALMILVLFPNLRRTAERAGRAAELLGRLERANAIQHQMLLAFAPHPRSRDDLLDRLRSTARLYESMDTQQPATLITIDDLLSGRL